MLWHRIKIHMLQIADFGRVDALLSGFAVVAKCKFWFSIGQDYPGKMNMVHMPIAVSDDIYCL